MGFTAYKHPDQIGKEISEDSSREWILDQIYVDNTKGGKRREREYAKVLKDLGCKIEWHNVK